MGMTSRSKGNSDGRHTATPQTYAMQDAQQSPSFATQHRTCLHIALGITVALSLSAFSSGFAYATNLEMANQVNSNPSIGNEISNANNSSEKSADETSATDENADNTTDDFADNTQEDQRHNNTNNTGEHESESENNSSDPNADTDTTVEFETYAVENNEEWQIGISNELDTDNLTKEVPLEEREIAPEELQPVKPAVIDVAEFRRQQAAKKAQEALQNHNASQMNSVDNTSNDAVNTGTEGFFSTDSHTDSSLTPYIASPAITPVDALATPVIDTALVSKPLNTGDSGNAYPYGQCTWWAYERRHALGLPVGSYFGNAKDWSASALSLGYSVSNVPTNGAILVFSPSQAGAHAYYGHVAVVEQVYEDGSIRISESNVMGVGVISSRTFTANQAAQFTYIH